MVEIWISNRQLLEELNRDTGFLKKKIIGTQSLTLERSTIIVHHWHDSNFTNTSVCEIGIRIDIQIFKNKFYTYT